MQITYQNPRKQAKADENENAVFSFLLFLGIGTFQRVAPDSNAFFSSRVRAARPADRPLRDLSPPFPEYGAVFCFCQEYSCAALFQMDGDWMLIPPGTRVGRMQNAGRAARGQMLIPSLGESGRG